MLCKFLAGPGDGFPVGGAGVVAKGKSRVHDEGVVGDCAVHPDKVGMVFDPREGALNVVVAGVAVMEGVEDG